MSGSGSSTAEVQTALEKGSTAVLSTLTFARGALHLVLSDPWPRARAGTRLAQPPEQT